MGGPRRHYPASHSSNWNVDAKARGEAWGLPAGCEDDATGEDDTLVGRSTRNAASVAEERPDGTAHADPGAMPTGFLGPGRDRPTGIDLTGRDQGARRAAHREERLSFRDLIPVERLAFSSRQAIAVGGDAKTSHVVGVDRECASLSRKREVRLEASLGDRSELGRMRPADQP